MNTKSEKRALYFEKFKAVLLVVLIVLCILQVGILWSSESGSFPISLFASTKSASLTLVEEAKSDYILPFRVVISEGFDGNHYIIPNGSNDYKELWKYAAKYITQALLLKPKQIKQFNEDQWGTLVANKPYTFEFKTEIPLEILNWALNINNNTNAEISGIYKVIISPRDSDNNYIDTVYIRDNENIYTYDIKDLKGSPLPSEELSEIYKRQKSSNGYSKKYQLAIETFRKVNVEISKDLLGMFSGKSIEAYPNIICKPVGGSFEQKSSYSDFDKITQDLLGKDRSYYDYQIDADVNGSIVFTKADGMYRLYKNSILEYKYTGNQENRNKLNIVEAYKKAICFILENNEHNDIMDGLKIYLSSIKQQQGAYIFNFDYGISMGKEKGEVPILLMGYEIPNTDKKLDNSISIEASSSKVISSRMLALKISVDNNFIPYEWDFVKMYDKVDETHSNALKGKEVSVKDFGIQYVLDYSEKVDKPIAPSFVLSTKDGKYDVYLK